MSTKKGDKLENAIEHIENAIFHVFPEYSFCDVEFERKKFIYPGGVKKEIDLFITIKKNNKLEEKLIFECKNLQQKDKVNPNDIIIFKEKINDVGASIGFFIAKRFTKYAILEAQKYPTLTLLKADDINVNIDDLPNSHLVYSDRDKTKIHPPTVFPTQTSNNKNIVFKSTEFKEVKYNNLTTSAGQFFHEFANNLIEEHLGKENTTVLDEGTHSLNAKKDFVFNTNQLEIDGIAVEKIELQVDYEIEVTKYKILSKFDIEKKGRHFEIVLNNDKITTKMSLISLKSSTYSACV